MSVEDEQEEYHYAEPHFPQVIFGDGHMAVLVRKEYVTDHHGNKQVKLIIRPDNELMKYFKIKEEDMDVEEGYAVEVYFDEEDVIIMNDDPVVGTILVLRDYLGRETKSSRLFIEFQHTIETLKREIEALKSNISYLHTELEGFGYGNKDKEK